MSYISDETPVTEHNYGEGIILLTPTCTAKGVLSCTCKVCGNEKTEETDRIAHTVVTDPAVPAGCETTGLTEGSHCSACGTVIVAQEETPSKGGHTPVTDPAVPAGCLTTGLTEGSHCLVCGEILKAQGTTAALGHTARTQEDGSVVCDVCNEILSVIEANGHRLSHVKEQNATCLKSGMNACYYCIDCGKYFTDETAEKELSMAEEMIPPVAHHLITGEEIPATLETPGMTAARYCEWCGTVFTESKEIAAMGNTAVITLPAGTRKIEMNAFSGNGIECVVIPNNCIEIGAYAFANCDALKLVVIGEQSITIDARAFDDSPYVVIVTPEDSPTWKWAQINHMSCTSSIEE